MEMIWPSIEDITTCPVCGLKGMSAVSLGKHKVYHETGVWPDYKTQETHEHSKEDN